MLNVALFYFSAEIAEFLDNVIDGVIVKVPKYTKIKIEDKCGYFAFASFEVNNQATFVCVNKFTSPQDRNASLLVHGIFMIHRH
jgi:hypothetical protein